MRVTLAAVLIALAIWLLIIVPAFLLGRTVERGAADSPEIAVVAACAPAPMKGRLL